MSEADPNQSMESKCPQCGAPLPSGVLAGLCPSCLLKQGAAADTGVEPEGPATFLPPSLEEVARMFPQLEILALLGKGGMGVVYKARQPTLDRFVALKILPPQTAAGSGFIERFNREARALAKLTHPNIVAVHEFGQVNGLPYFIMEFVDGLNLRELERTGELSAREALQIVPQICEALQFAHDEGIVHRDIKPENILLDKKGRVKIADFGIAKILGAPGGVAITETQGAIGTPHYMAPEQVEKPASVDHRADIFSLGVVFYEMLTGELPLGKFGPPSSRKVEVDVRLDEVVLHALEKDPQRRYQQVKQVKTDVDLIAGSAAPQPPNPGVIAEEILARDYSLNISSCLKRAWSLLKRDFWPLVGCTALVLALMALAGSGGGIVVKHGFVDNDAASSSSILGLLVYGPLMGGLSLYYLKKIRGEPAKIETAFSGFSTRFLHLFLAGFVTSVLTFVGFLFFVLPGVYLIVAWWFTLPLVIDKGLDFWPAMELSRKVITRHWFKFFGFFLVLLLLYIAGLAFLLVGLFIAAPLAMIAVNYAYEDIFGGAHSAAPAPTAAGLGPRATVRVEVPVAAPGLKGSDGKRFVPNTGLVVLLVTLAALVFLFAFHRHREARRALENARAAEQALADSATTTPASTPLDGSDSSALSSQEHEAAHQKLMDRFAAASEIGNPDAKDRAVSEVATDAAKIGEIELLNTALGQIRDSAQRDRVSHESALFLTKQGRRKEAIEIAKQIGDVNLRDQTLTELAH